MAANTQRLVTKNFKNFSATQFIESITEPANTIFYVFAGKHTPYTNGDSSVPNPNNSVQNLYIDPYREMVFGKKISSSDVKVMARRYDWVAGTVYAQYTHDDGEIYSNNFFTIARNGSNYHVFKCLYNANNAASTVQPEFNDTSADDEIYETSDGYQWKYLYSIPKSTFDKFATTDFIPVIPNANVTANAISGSIDVIQVTANGTGYNNFYSGQFGSSDISIGGNNLVFSIGSDSSTSNGYYANCVLKITEGTGKGQFRKITSSRVISSSKQVIVNSSFTTTPDSTSKYEISPYVNVIGDGEQLINCEARALINTAASNSIYKVEVLTRGSGYLFANASVEVPSALSISNTAVLKVIIPPSGGHGANVQSELSATRLGISVDFANGEANTIMSGNDFRTIGIIKDPKFANIGLSISNVSGTFLTNEPLYKVRKIKVDGTVSINTTSNVVTSSTLNLKDTFAANDYIFIRNESGQEISSIVVSAGGSGYITGEALTFTGGGGSNAEAYAITVNGSITSIRFSSITALSGLGSSTNGFTNDEIITITGQTSGASNASIQATTNSTGYLTAVTIVNGGSGYTSGETVDIGNSTVNATATVGSLTTGGAGFTNSETLSITGSNSTVSIATAIATTNATGGLTAATITGGGYNYVENETLQISSSGSSANATATVGISNGVIYSVLISDSGFGYSSAPTVGVTTVGGSGASLAATVNSVATTGKKMLVQVGTVTNTSQMTIKSNGAYVDASSKIYLANVGAFGTIVDANSSFLQANNVRGFFSVDDFIVGNTSLATANISSVQISNTTKSYTTFLQTNRYTGSSISGTFIEDEQVRQSNTTANAFLHTANTGNDTLYLTEDHGTFVVGETLTGNTSGASLTINTINKGDILPWSGDVVYIQNIDPISRSDEQTETIKIILEL